MRMRNPQYLASWAQSERRVEETAVKFRYTATADDLRISSGSQVDVVVDGVEIRIEPSTFEPNADRYDPDRVQRMLEVGGLMSVEAVTDIDASPAMNAALRERASFLATAPYSKVRPVYASTALHYWSHFPSPLGAELPRIQAQFESAALKAVNLWRWRRGDHSTSRTPFTDMFEIEFSTDGKVWHNLGGPWPYGKGALIGYSPIRPEHSEFVVRAATKNQFAPLAHDLLREAESNDETNPRSALILAISAAEVGFKHYVGKRVPDAQFLLEEMPSPPLKPMLERYLPQVAAKLTIGGEVLPPRKSVISTLHWASVARNKVAHSPTMPIEFAVWLSPEYQSKLFSSVRELLYLLDYYSGEDWALELICPEAQTEMIADHAKARSATELRTTTEGNCKEW